MLLDVPFNTNTEKGIALIKVIIVEDNKYMREG